MHCTLGDARIVVPSFLAGIGLGSIISYYLSTRKCSKKQGKKLNDTEKELIEFISGKLKKYPVIIDRQFIHFGDAIKPSNRIRIMQWNTLARALCNQKECSFGPFTPADVYDWSNYRKWRIIEELIRYKSDIICLEEIDTYESLKPFMTSLGYTGVFMPKHQSPCLEQIDNVGPDGLAIFYKASKFLINNMKCDNVRINGTNNSQVFIILQLKHKETNSLITLVCVHLKAKKNPDVRRNQIEFILNNLKSHLSTIPSLNEHPIILCGDFNGEPSETFYEYITNFSDINFTDSYFSCLNAKNERRASTFKIRETTGLVARTIDYIFYTNSCLNLLSYLNLPDASDLDSNIGIPNLSYPSDHFSLVCDFELLC